MRKSIFLFLFFLIISCSNNNNLASINAINGYWQINKVIDLDGNKKEYPINEVYDFFEIKNKIGFHKKVVWQPTGKFLVNDLQENIKINVVKDDVILDFSSRFGKHSDMLESISDQEMVLVSKENVKYYYTKVVLDEKNYGKKN